MVNRMMHWGIRAKLILLFVLIKVIPLLLLALLAWQGFSRLGGALTERTEQMADGVRATVGDLAKVMVDESVKALDRQSRDSLERLTTDTALAVADFLHDRDRDILLAASIEPSAENYRKLIANPANGFWPTTASVGHPSDRQRPLRSAKPRAIPKTSRTFITGRRNTSARASMRRSITRSRLSESTARKRSRSAPPTCCRVTCATSRGARTLMPAPSAILPNWASSSRAKFMSRT